VILMVALAVFNILVAAALPAWSTAIRREKEEELVFRGLQYAEAIRVFRNRFGRQPNRLEELIESEPRCLRQLWKDPMSEDGKWVLIFEGQVVPPGGQPGQPGQPPGFNPQGGGTEIPPESLPGGRDAVGDVVAVGPIKGVRSRSSQASILKFDGKERYDLWHFTTDLLAGGGGRVVQAGSGAGVPNVGGGIGIALSTRWIGRPWPRDVMPLVGGLPQIQPQQQPPGGGIRPGGNAFRPDPNRPPVIPGREQ
jgi:type II secretory pathway pseudopilin PulG